jgi:hypothetical protein
MPQGFYSKGKGRNRKVIPINASKGRRGRNMTVATNINHENPKKYTKDGSIDQRRNYINLTPYGGKPEKAIEWMTERQKEILRNYEVSSVTEIPSEHSRREYHNLDRAKALVRKGFVTYEN